MSEQYVNIPITQWRKLNEKIDALIALATPIVKSYKKPEWISEDEAMELTGLSKRSLLEYRKKGVFNYSSATGRKIKYRRVDIEKYITDNSTIIKR